MDTTPNLVLPYILAAQAQKHVTHNEAIRALDALVQMAVLDKDLTAPPASPVDGARYIVAAAATGAWTGRSGSIAAWQDGAWAYYAPREGWLTWVSDEDLIYGWSGTAWVLAGGGVNPVALVGVNATADTTNRLAVKSTASLFDNVGNGHQAKINKAAATDTASILFQTGYSGRAEMGTAGDDDFHFKVSADGATWREALIIGRTSGAVTLPLTPRSASLLINGDFQINQRGFVGGALAAGAYGRDRWKADTGGANMTLSGMTVTLASGTIVQVIEPAAWGYVNLASSQIAVSVDTPSADLTIALGSASGTITAGSGRRSVVLTTAAGDTGNLVLKITKATAGSVTFGRVKAEPGAAATAWEPRDATTEFALCLRYYEAMSGATGDRYIRRGYGANTGGQYYPVQFFGRKRAAPTVTLLAVASTNANTASAFNPSIYEFEFYHNVTVAGGFTYFGYSADAEL